MRATVSRWAAPLVLLLCARADAAPPPEGGMFRALKPIHALLTRGFARMYGGKAPGKAFSPLRISTKRGLLKKLRGSRLAPMGVVGMDFALVLFRGETLALTLNLELTWSGGRPFLVHVKHNRIEAPRAEAERVQFYIGVPASTKGATAPLGRMAADLVRRATSKRCPLAPLARLADLSHLPGRIKALARRLERTREAAAKACAALRAARPTGANLGRTKVWFGLRGKKDKGELAATMLGWLSPTGKLELSRFERLR